MGGSPLPLWSYRQRGDTDELTARRPLEGNWRDEFALIYAAAAERNISPLDADRMEIWVLASALGANRVDTDADPLTRDGYTWAERRELAFQRGEDMPSWDDEPMTPAEKAGQQRLMSLVPPTMPPEAVAGF